jgi:hypothetical protein
MQYQADLNELFANRTSSVKANPKNAGGKQVVQQWKKEIYAFWKTAGSF